MKVYDKGIRVSGEYFRYVCFADGEIKKPYIGTGVDVNDIYIVYKKPSQKKVNIWEYWARWFNKVSQSCDDWMQITSHNSQRFTISGVVTPTPGLILMIKITKNNSYAEEIASWVKVVNSTEILKRQNVEVRYGN